MQGGSIRIITVFRFKLLILSITVPSACLQNISSFRITDNNSFIKWRDLPEGHRHGVFRGFNIDITEKLQDGIVTLRRSFFINKTTVQEMNPLVHHFTFTLALSVSNVYIANDNNTLNRSAQFFYLKLLGLKAYALYNVSLASCTTPGCGLQCRSTFLTKEKGEF